jgi:hypothetical protein
MITFMLAWYFTCIGPGGYDYFSDRTCDAQLRTFEKALNYRMRGWYDVPFRDKRF